MFLRDFRKFAFLMWNGSLAFALFYVFVKVAVTKKKNQLHTVGGASGKRFI